MDRHALIVGVTGIQGRALADRLVRNGWLVTGLARRPTDISSGVQPVAADLLDAKSLSIAVRDVHPTHIFFNAWLRQATEAENIVINGAMFRNLLAALDDQDSVRHVALATGLKHYLGPFEAYARIKPDTPFREEQARLDYPNFYYEQEDILFASAKRNAFTWSVHRPHTVIGFAIGNAMNMGTILAVYATICRVTGRPFVFPGSPEQYGAVTDVTDARILASQLEWAALTDSAANQALNIVNGDVFRWRRMWGLVAEMLRVAPADYPGHPTPLVEQMQDAGPLWDDITRRFGLRALPLDTLASWWHTDADLGRTIETLTDMSKSRRLGFLEYQETAQSFRDLFNRLRTERIIPDKDSN